MVLIVPVKLALLILSPSLAVISRHAEILLSLG